MQLGTAQMQCRGGRWSWGWWSEVGVGGEGRLHQILMEGSEEFLVSPEGRDQVGRQLHNGPRLTGWVLVWALLAACLGANSCILSLIPLSSSLVSLTFWQ